MPPITTTANTTMISVRAHQRADLNHRRGEHAGERRQRDAEAIGHGDHQRHVDAERLDQLRVLGARAQEAPSRVRSITNQVAKQTTSDATRPRRDSSAGT